MPYPRIVPTTMSTSTFARHLLVSGLDSSSGLELDTESPGGAGGGARGRSSGGAVEVGASDFNPLERAYRPRMLRVLPDPAARAGEEAREQWLVTDFSNLPIVKHG